MWHNRSISPVFKLGLSCEIISYNQHQVWALFTQNRVSSGAGGCHAPGRMMVWSLVWNWNRLRNLAFDVQETACQSPWLNYNRATSLLKVQQLLYLLLWLCPGKKWGLDADRCTGKEGQERGRKNDGEEREKGRKRGERTRKMREVKRLCSKRRAAPEEENYLRLFSVLHTRVHLHTLRGTHSTCTNTHAHMTHMDYQVTC